MTPAASVDVATITLAHTLLGTLAVENGKWFIETGHAKKTESGFIETALNQKSKSQRVGAVQRKPAAP